jgi:hypothetical protein
MDSNKFLVGTSLKLPSFDEARSFQFKKYWQDHGFKFILTDSSLLLARRGAFVKTFFSMNPRHLQTKLTANWTEEKELECVMEINLFLQQTTEWHKAFLELEMITFESYMLNEDKKASLWRDFEEDLRQADATYMWTAGIFGKKLPDNLRSKYLGR